MSNSTDRAREELVRARILCDIANMAEANRHFRLLQSQTEREKSVPADVPLHQRGSESWMRTYRVTVMPVDAPGLRRSPR